MKKFLDDDDQDFLDMFPDKKATKAQEPDVEVASDEPELAIEDYLSDVESEFGTSSSDEDTLTVEATNKLPPKRKSKRMPVKEQPVAEDPEQKKRGPKKTMKKMWYQLDLNKENRPYVRKIFACPPDLEMALEYRCFSDKELNMSGHICAALKEYLKDDMKVVKMLQNGRLKK